MHLLQLTKLDPSQFIFIFEYTKTKLIHFFLINLQFDPQKFCFM